MEYVHGGDIYTYGGMLDFSANINPFGPPVSAIEAAKDALGDISHYPDSRCRELAEAVSARIGIEPGHIMFGNGAADLIFTLAFSERPARALIPSPTFAEYEQALAAVGCEVQHHPLDREAGFALDQSFVDRIDEDVDIVFLCSPNNPTGKVISVELLDRVLEKCSQTGTRMVLDECFCDFLERPGDHTMVGRVRDGMHPQLVVMRAFTKVYGMPGLRLGYMLTSDEELLERMWTSRQPWSVSNVAQAAGIAAIAEEDVLDGDGNGWSARTREYVARERRHLEEGLSSLGIGFLPSDANFIFMWSDVDLFSELLEHRILIRDCSNYEGLEKGFYRIAVKTREENDRLLAALAEVLGK